MIASRGGVKILKIAKPIQSELERLKTDQKKESGARRAFDLSEMVVIASLTATLLPP